MEHIRSSTAASGGLTEEEWKKLSEHHQRWVNVSSRKEPVDQEKIATEIKRLYVAASLATPRVAIVTSPGVMAFAGTFAKHILENQHNDKNYIVTLPEFISIQCDEKYSAIVKEVIVTLSRIITVDNDFRDGIDSADVCSRTLDATYNLVDGPTANALDRKTNMDIRQGLDHLPLCDLGCAIEEAMKEPFGNSTFTELMKINVDEWGLELAKKIFKDEDKAAVAVNAVCDWWQCSQSGTAKSYYDYCITAARDVLGLKIPGNDKYKIWEECTINSVYRYMHPVFCLACDFPSEIVDKKLDTISPGSGQNFYYWRDGWSV